MQKRDELEVQVKAVKHFEAAIRDNRELIEMGDAEGDAEIVKEAEAALREALKEARSAQVETLLSGEADANDCYVEIHSGAGGTDPCGPLIAGALARSVNGKTLTDEQANQFFGCTEEIKGQELTGRGHAGIAGLQGIRIRGDGGSRSARRISWALLDRQLVSEGGHVTLPQA